MTGYEDRLARSRAEDQQLTDALDQLGIDIAPGPEWHVIFALLRGSWPGALSSSDALAYVMVLSDLPPGDVARAVRKLARAGRKYRPTPPEVRTQLGATTDDEPAPTFDEAWAAICHAGAVSRWDADRAGEMLTGAIGAWAQLRGLDRLWQLPTEDPDGGRFVLRDLERSYASFCEAWAVPARREQLAAPRRGELGPLRPMDSIPRPQQGIEG